MYAVVTGASSGIGRDIAKELAKKGYDIIAVARNEEALNQLKEEIETINNTTFNDVKLFAEKDSFQTHTDERTGNLVFQVGPLSGQYINVHLFPTDTEALGIDDVDIKTEEDGTRAIEAFDKAIEYIGVKRSYYGAIEGRLEHTLQQIEVNSLDKIDTESRIRDVDVEKTLVQYATTDILMQSGISLIAQSGQINSRGIMSLLGWMK